MGDEEAEGGLAMVDGGTTRVGDDGGRSRLLYVFRIGRLFRSAFAFCFRTPATWAMDSSSSIDRDDTPGNDNSKAQPCKCAARVTSQTLTPSPGRPTLKKARKSSGYDEPSGRSADAAPSDAGTPQPVRLSPLPYHARTDIPEQDILRDRASQFRQHSVTLQEPHMDAPPRDHSPRETHAQADPHGRTGTRRRTDWGGGGGGGLE